MHDFVARLARLLATALLAYVAVGVAWELAVLFAFPPSPTSDIPPPWRSLGAFVAWFALPALLWPWSVSEFLPGGALIAAAMLAGMTAVMLGTLAVAGRRRPASPR